MTEENAGKQKPQVDREKEGVEVTLEQRDGEGAKNEAVGMDEERAM